ncbi:MAG TPA: hypothetical protein VGP87_07080 [Gemmatimonadales bacterium]|jgi:hypothetical protein|nr:hypothetical protein [Gemmatimonadales bacterium]
MRLRSRLIALVAFGAAGSTGGLAAQVAGLPVRNAGVGTGIGIAADVGFPNGDAGKGIALGATGAIGLGPLGVTGSVATWNPKGPGKSVNSVGLTGNLKILGGPLIPLSVTFQTGVGYWKVNSTSVEGDALSTKTWHVPVGVGVALTIPNPVFSIKPWLAPRVDVARTTASDGGTATQTSHTRAKFGISGGVDLGFLSGLAIRVMYDRVSLGGHVTPSVLSLGLGFKVGT